METEMFAAPIWRVRNGAATFTSLVENMRSTKIGMTRSEFSKIPSVRSSQSSPRTSKAWTEKSMKKTFESMEKHEPSKAIRQTSRG